MTYYILCIFVLCKFDPVFKDVLALPEAVSYRGIATMRGAIMDRGEGRGMRWSQLLAVWVSQQDKDLVR